MDYNKKQDYADVLEAEVASLSFLSHSWIKVHYIMVKWS